MRLVRSSTAFATAIALAVLAVHGQILAQERTSRLVAVIGIPREVAPVETHLEEPKVTHIQGIVFTSGTINGMRVVTARSGVGKVNAAMTATLLLEHFVPAAVVFTGTAGAVDPELSPADVVIGIGVGFHDFGNIVDSGFVRAPTRDPVSGKLDPAFFSADPNLLAAARRASSSIQLSRGPRADGLPPRILEGLIVTGDAFIANATSRAGLRRDLKATATEMEGAAVMQVCARFGVPAIVIRSITDRADPQATDSYRQFIETASTNAAELTIATIREFLK